MMNFNPVKRSPWETIVLDYTYPVVSENDCIQTQSTRLAHDLFAHAELLNAREKLVQTVEKMGGVAYRIIKTPMQSYIKDTLPLAQLFFKAQIPVVLPVPAELQLSEPLKILGEVAKEFEMEGRQFYQDPAALQSTGSNLSQGDYINNALIELRCRIDSPEYLERLEQRHHDARKARNRMVALLKKASQLYPESYGLQLCFVQSRRDSQYLLQSHHQWLKFLDTLNGDYQTPAKVGYMWWRRFVPEIGFYYRMWLLLDGNTTPHWKPMTEVIQSSWTSSSQGGYSQVIPGICWDAPTIHRQIRHFEKQSLRLDLVPQVDIPHYGVSSVRPKEGVKG